MRGEFNNGSAVSRDITRHFSAPLGVRQRLAARDSSPGGCRMPGLRCRHQTKGLWRLDISPKVPSPATERVAVLGDMPWVSRATACGPTIVIWRAGSAMSRVVKSCNAQSVNHADRTWECHYLVCRSRVGGTPRAIRSNNATAVRHAFRWRCADRGNNCGAGAICSKVGPTTSRQDAAGKLDLLLPQAMALGAPMAAVE